jgi:nucleoside-diphosphate-sugar epimerase
LRKQLLEYKSEMGGWDYIIHNLGITKSQNKDDFYRINYEYVRNFIEALIACDMVPRKFIYMSSLSAWGKGDEKNYTPFKLTDTPQPDTHYGKSKLMTEKYLTELSDFPYIILRPTGVYGPRDKDYLVMMQCNKWMIDFRAGYRKQVITFLYVKDLIRAIFMAVKSPLSRRSYFLSDENSYTSSSFSKYVCAELKRPFIIPVVLPCWVIWVIAAVSDAIGKRVGKVYTVNRDKYSIMCQRNWKCDTSATREELGFVPEYSLEEGIKETVAWYRTHKML